MAKTNQILEKLLFEAVLNKNTALFKKTISKYSSEKFSELVCEKANAIREVLNAEIG
jgi:ketopantoate reductase